MSRKRTISAETLRNVVALVKACSPRARRGLWLGAVVAFFVALAEAFSVGAVVPFVLLLVQPEALTDFPRIVALVPERLLNDRAALAIVGSVFFIAVYCIKVALTIFGQYVKSKVGSFVSYDLGTQIFSNILDEDFQTFQKRGTPKNLVLASNDVQNSGNAAQQATQFITEALSILFIGALVLMVSPWSLMTAALVVGIPAVLVYRFSRSRLIELGAHKRRVDAELNKNVMEGVTGFREIVVLERRAFYKSRQRHIRQAISDNTVRLGVLDAIPKNVIELATVAGVLLVAVVLIVRGDGSSVAPVLALYAAAAFRLMPSVNRILNVMGLLNKSQASVKSVLQYLAHQQSGGPKMSSTEATLQGPPSMSPLIEIVDLSFEYQGAKQPALAGINLDISRGSTTGVVGLSGSGKSTLIDVLLGLYQATSGEVRVSGRRMPEGLADWRRHIGYVPQSIFIAEGSMVENIALGLATSDVDTTRVWACLEAAQLREFVESLPLGLDTPVGERGVLLSGGQRQRLGIARALYHQPEVLILDEATSALDSQTEAGFMQAVYRLRGQITILMVAHRITTVSACDQILVMRDGCIVDRGTYEELLARSAYFRSIAGAHHPGEGSGTSLNEKGTAPWVHE